MSSYADSLNRYLNPYAPPKEGRPPRNSVGVARRRERLRERRIEELDALPAEEWVRAIDARYDLALQGLAAQAPRLAAELRAHLEGHPAREQEAARVSSARLDALDAQLRERHLPLPPREYHERGQELIRLVEEHLPELFHPGRAARYSLRRDHNASAPEERHAAFKRRSAREVRQALQRQRAPARAAAARGARRDTLKLLDDALASFERTSRGLRCLFGDAIDLDSNGFFADLSLGGLGAGCGGGEGLNTLTPLYELVSSAEVEGLIATLGRATGGRREGLAASRELRAGPSHLRAPEGQAREEVAGVSAGRDLSALLPSEYALLSAEPGAGRAAGDPGGSGDQGDEERQALLELLFYKRLAEGTLNVYELEGEEEAPAPTAELVDASAPALVDERGPFLICVDTSGSMSGIYERRAKAITLAALRVAYRERRRCFLVNFSTRVACAELSPDGSDLARLLQVVTGSFNGGTDIGFALERACEQLEEREYALADVLVVSDFDYGSVPPESAARVAARRALGARFKAAPVVDYVLPDSILSFYDDALPFSRDWGAWLKPFGGL